MLTDLEKNAIRDHYQNIGKSLPGFRPRAAQREMIAAIANAFSRSQSRAEGEEAPKREGESIAVIEGPTGAWHLYRLRKPDRLCLGLRSGNGSACYSSDDERSVRSLS